MSGPLEPGDRVRTPSGLEGVYLGPFEAPDPDWHWVWIRCLFGREDGREFVYPVWLLERSDDD